MSQRFSYVQYDAESATKQQDLKALFEGVEQYADKNISDGRAKSLVMTHLEIAYMWTGKAIRDEQIARTGKVEEQTQRGNE